MSKNITATTESLCPACLARIPAERRMEGNDLVLVKSCPDHGEFRTVVWRDGPDLAGWTRVKEVVSSSVDHPGTERGCPFDCGICPNHRQQSCTVLLEVTSRCNLSCAFCFADAGAAGTEDPSLETIAGWYRTALHKSGAHNIVQISGGEATLRRDLPDIVALGRHIGFPYIQLNTNGIRLAVDRDYAPELKDAGLFSVFLQFDGTDDRIYRAIRGRDLLDKKLRAIENCAACGLGVVLVPTVVPGVNSDDVGAILKLALELGPAVRGVHFQPASYFGRHRKIPTSEARVTLPDLMRAIEEQTCGLMKVEHFRPPGCEHPMCSFHGNFLRLPESGVRHLTEHAPSCCCGAPAEPERGTGKAVSFVTRQWSGVEAGPDAAPGSIDAFVEDFRKNTLAVSAMAFQDVWNLDLERVQECCIHVVAPDGRMVPFCLYNMTAADGTRLYRS